MDQRIELLVKNIEKVIVGKREIVLKVVASMLAGGHVLIEDVPGVGKTQLVSALAKSVSGKFNRIQLTPDVMPSDIIGYTMIHPESRKMEYRQGAAVCNFLLADEINRASPKVQSGLLEIMEEAQISIEGTTYRLPPPFMTLATQNPVETYGTYHLPEAQMDRFLMRVSLGYPSLEEELTFLDHTSTTHPSRNLQSVITLEDVLELQKQSQSVYAGKEVQEYILKIVTATRKDENIKLGVSPRGSIGLNRAAKAFAFIDGRNYVTPDDIRDTAESVLAHRILLSSKGKSNFGSKELMIRYILSSVTVPVPRVV